jgi:hypothetical protein
VADPGEPFHAPGGARPAAAYQPDPVIRVPGVLRVPGVAVQVVRNVVTSAGSAWSDAPANICGTAAEGTDSSTRRRHAIYGSN